MSGRSLSALKIQEVKKKKKKNEKAFPGDEVGWGSSVVTVVAYVAAVM